MENELVGKMAELPSGERVIIESVELGSAVIRRMDGGQAGTRAVCLLTKLDFSKRPVEESLVCEYCGDSIFVNKCQCQLIHDSA